MAEAVGPCFAGGFESYVINDKTGEAYTLAYLPDRANDALQQEGKAPVFYYLPEAVRLAREGDKGDFKFHQTHFVGVFDETSVGIDRGETQGGVVAFTTTARFPTEVLQQSQQQLIQKFNGKDDKYWGIRTRVTPMFRMAPITSAVTAVSNIFPNSDGTTPQLPNIGGAGGGGTGGGTTTPAPGGGAAGPAPGAASPGGVRLRSPGSATGVDSLWSPVPHGRGFRAPLTIEPWAFRLEGNGPSSITGGENAFAGMLGPLASEVLWAGFHGAYSPIAISQHFSMPMWSQLMRVKITGKWSRIFDHFSAAASAHYLWFAADIKAEFNRMRMSGDLKVEVDIDGTMPGAADMERAINTRIDTIVAQFTEIAKKVIFDPPAPTVEAAQAPSGGIFSSIFGGGGLALKVRHDATYVDLNYEETRYFRYIQPHAISSNLQAFYNEIKKDSAAEQKYFTRLILGGLGRKVLMLVKPVVEWPRPEQQYIGQPVAFLSAQVGYPTMQGGMEWKPNTFQASDPADVTWRPAFIQLKKEEAKNPPAGWAPDIVYLKRKVHMKEGPGENQYPYTKVYVERNEVDLDPEPNGTGTNERIVEARADDAGTLDVGPMYLSVALSSSAEVVEVELRAKGKRADGVDRLDKVSRLRWAFADQDEPRYYRIFTGQIDFVPAYQYRVNVTVRGTLSSKGQAWTGPWVDAIGNGSLTIQVPAADDPGVVKRSLTAREMFSTDIVRAAPDLGVPSGAGTPDGAPLPVGAPSGAPGAPVYAPEPALAGAPRSDGGSTSPGPPSSANGGVTGAGDVQGYRIQARRGDSGTSVTKSTTSSGSRSRPAENDPGEWVEAPVSLGGATRSQSEEGTSLDYSDRNLRNLQGQLDRSEQPSVIK